MIKNSRYKVLLYIILIVTSFIMIYPFVWSITASFKTNAQLYNGNPLDLIPRPFTVDNYKRVWSLLPFGRFIANSLLMSTVVPFFSVLISLMAAYAFARLNFKGKDIIFLTLLGVMMLPGHIVLIPRYSMMRWLGWINSYWALIIPPIFSAALVVNIFFMRQYYLGIPRELEEAALIDGCSWIKVWWKIIIPNSKPAIATIAIISFKAQWNNFLWPNIVINDFLKMPLQVGLTYLQSSAETGWDILMAGTSISIIPIILVFLFFQRYFISSVLNSGMGGK